MYVCASEALLLLTFRGLDIYGTKSAIEPTLCVYSHIHPCSTRVFAAYFSLLVLLLRVGL